MDPVRQHSLPEQLARKALRRLFRGKLITRSLPGDLGGARIRVAPESMLKYLKPGPGGLDRMLLRLARDFVKPGDLVWDIGANVGVFSFACAGKGARVLAVEPDPAMSKAILESRALNPQLQVELLTAALSDAPGLAELAIASGGRASNALTAFAGDRNRFGQILQTVIVPTLTADSLLARGAPNFVKIDVEGAELAVLQSATELLAKVRPVMQVETGPQVRDAVTALLKTAGYRLYDTTAWMQPIEICTENTICIPADRAP